MQRMKDFGTSSPKCEVFIKFHLHFWDHLSLNPGLTLSTRLTCQWAFVICLSLPSPSKEVADRLLPPPFICCWDSILKISLLLTEHFTPWAASRSLSSPRRFTFFDLWLFCLRAWVQLAVSQCQVLKAPVPPGTHVVWTERSVFSYL